MTLYVLGPLVHRAKAGTVSMATLDDSTEYPNSNLTERRLSKRTRSAGTSTPESLINVNLGAEFPIATSGIIGTNLDGSGQARARLSSSSISGFVRTAPDAELATVNTTGLLTNINEDIDSLDGLGYTGDTPINDSEIRLGFSPGAMQTSPIEMHMFRVTFKADALNPLNVGDVDLYENGIKVRSLWENPLTPTASVEAGKTRTLSFRFASNELTDTSDIEIHIQWQSVASGGVLDAVDLNYLASNSSVVETPWVDVLPNPVANQVGGTDPAESLSVRPSAAFIVPDDSTLLPSHVDAQYIQIHIWNPDNSDGFIEVSRVEAGPAIVLNEANKSPLEAPEFYTLDEGTEVIRDEEGQADYFISSQLRRGVRLSTRASDETFANNFMNFISLSSRSVQFFFIPYNNGDVPTTVLDLPFWGERTGNKSVLNSLQSIPGFYATSVDILEVI
jgi:hypothetical protein